MTHTRPRITQLDGLRACAIAAVFLHHAFGVRMLWMGVDLFFVLSGFLITGILLNEKAKSFRSYITHFYSRRARRILPPYVLFLACVAIWDHGYWLHYWYLYIGGMNFLQPLGIPHPLAVSPLWSLAVEEQFYLLWPIAIFYLKRKQLLWCTAGLMLLSPALRFFCTPLFDRPWAIYMMLPFRMDTLAAGAMAAIIWPYMRKRIVESHFYRKRLALLSSIAFGAGVGLILFCAHSGFTTYGRTRIGNAVLYEATLLISAGAFLITLIGYGLRVLSSWPFVWLGRISYCFYLVHSAFLHLWPRRLLLALIVSLQEAQFGGTLLSGRRMNQQLPGLARESHTPQPRKCFCILDYIPQRYAC